MSTFHSVLCCFFRAQIINNRDIVRARGDTRGSLILSQHFRWNHFQRRRTARFLRINVCRLADARICRQVLVRRKVPLLSNFLLLSHIIQSGAAQLYVTRTEYLLIFFRAFVKQAQFLVNFVGVQIYCGLLDANWSPAMWLFYKFLFDHFDV